MEVPQGYKQTSIGIIPEDWEVKKLGEIGSILNGITYTPDQIVNNDGLLVLRSSNILNGRLVFEDKIYIDNEGIKFNDVIERDILICVRNGSRSLIGKNALITKEAQGFGFGAFMAVFRSKENEFVYQIMDTDFFYKEVHKNLGATINSINGSDLKKFKIPFPPNIERKKIAEILSTWDKAIETCQKTIEELRLRNKGLAQQLLQKNESWKKFRISELITEQNRPVIWNDDEEYSLISVKRRSEGIFFRQKLFGREILTKTLSTIHEGDFLISKMQIVHGASALVSKEYDGMKVSGSYIVVRSKSTDLMDIQFFNYISKSKWFYRLCFISSYGVHIEKMTFDFNDFKKHYIYLPEINTQKRIVSILDTAASELKHYEEKLANLKLQKKGLMQQLLTGKVRVKI